jgi:hypothetical protein
MTIDAIHNVCSGHKADIVELVGVAGFVIVSLRH